MIIKGIKVGVGEDASLDTNLGQDPAPIVVPATDPLVETTDSEVGQPLTEVVEFAIEFGLAPAQSGLSLVIGRKPERLMGITKQRFGQHRHQEALFMSPWNEMQTNGVTGFRRFDAADRWPVDQQFIAGGTGHEMHEQALAGKHLAGSRGEASAGLGLAVEHFQFDTGAGVDQPPTAVAVLEPAELPMKEGVVIDVEFGATPEHQCLIDLKQGQFTAVVDQQAAFTYRLRMVFEQIVGVVHRHDQDSAIAPLDVAACSTSAVGRSSIR